MTTLTLRLFPPHMSSFGSSTRPKNSTSGQGILVSNPNRQRNLLNNIVGGELVMYLNLIEKYQVLHPKYFFSSTAILQKGYGPLQKNVTGPPINHKIYLVQQVMIQSPKKNIASPSNSPKDMQSIPWNNSPYPNASLRAHLSNFFSLT